MSAGLDTLPSPQILADAFAEFISASSVLEASYRDLQREVARLSLQLEERNAALNSSLAENDRMRIALQQILDSMPCGVLVLNHAEQIVTINPEARRLLNLGDKSVRNLRQLPRIGQIDLASLMRHHHEQVDTEVCVRTETGTRWLAIGNRKLFNAQRESALSASETHAQTLWILRDITAGKQAELEREAARRATVLAEISTILAHEIRNPLASLELFAELIEQDREDSAQWISNLRAGIRTLSGIVNNVLSLHGESKTRLVTINLAGSVRRGVDFVRPIAEQAGVALHFSSDEDVPVILGNEDGIRQVVLNITSNAIRHTTEGGSISVSVRARTSARVRSALVEITDTGCGIPEHLLEKIFESGFSASGETPGLGLAVCKQIIDQHRGQIRVMSKEKTTFQLEFPAI
jgi:two-component system sensor histidine kinase FlrB